MTRLNAAAVLAGLLVAGVLTAWSRAAHAQTAGDCVTIGKPASSTDYNYERRDSSGTVTQYTQRWEEVTDTGARLRATRRDARGVTTTELIQNEHHIVDDVGVIEVTTTSDAGGRVTGRTTFRPGAMGDPAFRACAGRSWSIPAVTATYASGQRTTSAQTYAGTMTIVAVRESVTVPAGQFDAVRYTRTLAAPTGRSVDEYWKSIEHGVVVKHTSQLPGWTSTETLQSIRP